LTGGSGKAKEKGMPIYRVHAHRAWNQPADISNESQSFLSLLDKKFPFSVFMVARKECAPRDPFIVPRMMRHFPRFTHIAGSCT
jgi:hypothetical protein